MIAYVHSSPSDQTNIYVLFGLKGPQRGPRLCRFICRYPRQILGESISGISNDFARFRVISRELNSILLEHIEQDNKSTLWLRQSVDIFWR